MTTNIIPDFPHAKANAKSLAKRRLIFGVGINNAPYKISAIIDGSQSLCPFYRVWVSMIRRAYDTKFHARQPTYKTVTVCDEWHSFMAFRAWMETQDWQEKQIDKDLLIPGNQIYSPNACVFVTQEINKLLTDHGSARGAYPQGVHFHKSCGRYVAEVSKWAGNRRHIGTFDTPKEASSVYKEEKSKHIREIASEQSEPLRSALCNHADSIQNHGVKL